MTVPEYPLLTPGGYEMYQLAQIATYLAERLAAHRRAPRGRPGRAARAGAVRDLAGAAAALDAVHPTDTAVSPERLPRPLDRATFARAEQLVGSGARTAYVVAMPGTGWAAIGHIPGIGEVGASAPTVHLAEALRHHLLTAPLEQVRPWAVSGSRVRVPTLPKRVDLAAFVERLDPRRGAHRAIADALRHAGPGIDAALAARFGAPDIATPSAPVITSGSRTPPRRGATVRRRVVAGRPRPGARPAPAVER